METGGAESAEEIAQAGPALAQRWIVHSAPETVKLENRT